MLQRAGPVSSCQIKKDKVEADCEMEKPWSDTEPVKEGDRDDSKIDYANVDYSKNRLFQ